MMYWLFATGFLFIFNRKAIVYPRARSGLENCIIYLLTNAGTFIADGSSAIPNRVFRYRVCIDPSAISLYG